MAEALVRVAALIFAGISDLNAKNERPKVNEKETKNTDNMAIFPLMFVFFITE